MDNILVEFENVTKKFDDKVVLDNISFKIRENSIVGLLGKNGVGKTTILKIINDLLTIDSGKVLIDGKKVGIETKKIISFLPERTYFDAQAKVSSIIKFFSEFYEDFDIEKNAKLLKELNLDENMELNKMSKGMKEKLQLIFCLSRNAKLYVLDEPLGGVDPSTREHILTTIISNCNDGSSILISTHLITDVEKILDEVIIINGGKIFLQKNADNLRENEKMSIDEYFRRSL